MIPSLVCCSGRLLPIPLIELEAFRIHTSECGCVCPDDATHRWPAAVGECSIGAITRLGVQCSVLIYYSGPKEESWQ